MGIGGDRAVVTYIIGNVLGRVIEPRLVRLVNLVKLIRHWVRLEVGKGGPAKTTLVK